MVEGFARSDGSQASRYAARPSPWFAFLSPPMRISFLWQFQSKVRADQCVQSPFWPLFAPPPFPILLCLEPLVVPFAFFLMTVPRVRLPYHPFMAASPFSLNIDVAYSSLTGLPPLTFASTVQDRDYLSDFFVRRTVLRTGL